MASQPIRTNRTPGWKNALAANFEMVNPEGQRLSRDELLALLRQSHGSQQGTDYALQVRNISIEPLGEKIFRVKYEEWQRLGESVRGRRSTAVMRLAPQAPEGVEWLEL